MNHNMNPSAMKRIRKEIALIKEKLTDYEAEIELPYNDDENKNRNINRSVNLQVMTPNYNILVFTIPNDYPFKPPISLSVNGHNYRFLLKNMPRRIHYLYEHPNDVYYKEGAKIAHYKKPNCLCCSTLICPDNWSPVCTLYSVLNEIKGHNQLKSQIGYKLVLKDIIDKFGLPVEIIRYLFGFL